MHFFVYNTLVRFVRGIVMRADALTMTLLYDYYGELLTEKQRQLFDLYYNQDYSLSEIAQTAGISRQGVHDTLARAEQLLDRYGNSLLRYAYSYLHNMEDAEEVLQDTLMQILKTAPVFLSREHEKAWLLRVAANLSKNRLSYNKLRQTDELNEELTAEGREDLSFVWDAVRQLPESCREAVHLFYYEGLSTKQIASVLQRKESTVRSDLHRGREQLKTILKEAYDFEV